jgi:outer membrane protein assembly factor BamB
MPRLVVLASAFAFGALTIASASEQWPQFRGVGAGAAADHPALPETWSRTENVAWTLDVPGIGWSSPVVWDKTIFITSVIRPGPVELPTLGFYNGNSDYSTPTSEHRWMVYAVDFDTGRLRWEREVRRGTPPAGKHSKNTYASETPATDGERLYAYFGGVGLFALDLSGKPLWSKPMDSFNMRGMGTASSPVVHQNRVYIVNDNDDNQSSLSAYDSRSGDVIWHVKRDEGSNWSTPYVWEHERGTEIVTTGTKKARSYDLNGRLKWELVGLTTFHIPTPIASHGLVFISSGYLGDPVRPVYAVRPGASGDITLAKGQTSNEFIAWSNPRLGTYGTSALVYGDYYYTLMDRGFLVCTEAKSGKEVYARQRITSEASGFSASPWAYNGKIFALSEDGDTFVMQAGPEFKVLGKNSLDEIALATPAIAHGSLIVRTASKLYRITNQTAR